MKATDGSEYQITDVNSNGKGTYYIRVKLEYKEQPLSAMYIIEAKNVKEALAILQGVMAE
jgi:hypothetical protein